MESSQLSKRRSQLVDLSYELSVLYASEQVGEPFHPEYQEDKDAFRQLVSSHIKLERALKHYFRELAPRAYQLVEWSDYSKRLTAEEFIRDLSWDDEVLQLKVIFSDNLFPAFGAGLLAANTELSLTSGLTMKDAPALKALRKHGLTLAKGLTRTTKDRIKESLKSSLDLGLSSSDAAEALQSVVNDPVRAKLISDTESVKAYSQGKLAVGRQVGAKGKSWLAIPTGACPFCQGVNGETVPIDALFSNGVDFPPGHPRCRCLGKIVLVM